MFDLFLIKFVVTEKGSCHINACQMSFEAGGAAFLIRLKYVTLHEQRCGELQLNQEKIIFIFTDAIVPFQEFSSDCRFSRAGCGIPDVQILMQLFYFP